MFKIISWLGWRDYDLTKLSSNALFSASRKGIASLFRLLVLAKASFSRTAQCFTEPRDVLLKQNREFKSAITSNKEKLSGSETKMLYNEFYESR
jgi:hypothetical protein